MKAFNDTTIYLHHLVNGEIFFLPFKEVFTEVIPPPQKHQEVDNHEISNKVNQLIMSYWG